MITVTRRAGLALGLCLLFIVASYTVAVHRAYGQPVASSGHPTVQGAMSPHPYPRVIAKGWLPITRVTVTVRFYGLTATRKFHTTRTGTFGVGIQGVDWCQNLTLVVRDAMGHRVVTHGSIPKSVCTPPGPNSKIVLHILTPKQMQAKQITVDATKITSSQTMHVGDVLYVYDPNQNQPSIVLSFDASHFRSIEQGQVPACPPTASCAVSTGFFWRLVATAVGDGIVTLSPACRQSKPPCMLPDRALRVTILP
jgi:hypothetical protein